MTADSPRDDKDARDVDTVRADLWTVAYVLGYRLAQLGRCQKRRPPGDQEPGKPG